MIAQENGLPVIASFWHGPLSWLEHLCIRSFIAQGHVFHLYSYAPVPDIPTGAVWHDAAKIVPEDRLVFYKGHGTPAVFSDYFRLKLLQAEAGIWSDADIFCVRPFADLPDYLMGFERPGSINVAVLSMPANAPLLDDLIKVFSAENRPLFEPHLPPIRRLEVATKRLVGLKVPPENMQYGATGPFALTHFARQRGLWDQVQPPPVFYPVPYEDVPALMQPGSRIEVAITPETLGVHVWRSQFTNRGRAGMQLPAPNSAMALLCARHNIDPVA
ncbi:hypothetical protein PSQ19_15175 [Devosia algicola]|uniref:Alpha 1,4-glycosyltransferase domain-containing protein n=1 Tax=Devosia algicola TaxID=3026418 RepID=A0ABY7YL83_9HYPH|nr:hypothetical protein [Devosia algicola]WDR02011.1 hypothetical protein PSQ19_15175 [Devosia algicola]